jgi:phospholipase/carboxylesterase
MSEPVQVDGDATRLTYRFKPAQSGERLSVVLLHGFTGDERVLWVLEGALPPGSLLVAPRAPFPAAPGGFSWRRSAEPALPEVEDFGDGAKALRELLDHLQAARELDRSRLVVLGFSQGAALAFSAVCLGDLRPAALVALAGFLPRGDASPLSGLPVFWAHGTQDELVPIARARQDAERLRTSGARVTLCESDVGHKLGADCLRGLRAWIAETFPGLSES